MNSEEVFADTDPEKAVTRKALICALVPPQHQRLYMTSAAFKSTVETLARMLPSWIDGLAIQCAEMESDLNENLHRAMSGQPLGTVRLPEHLDRS